MSGTKVQALARLATSLLSLPLQKNEGFSDEYTAIGEPVGIQCSGPGIPIVK
jgi:hypothetical protein